MAQNVRGDVASVGYEQRSPHPGVRSVYRAIKPGQSWVNRGYFLVVCQVKPVSYPAERSSRQLLVGWNVRPDVFLPVSHDGSVAPSSYSESSDTRLVMSIR